MIKVKWQHTYRKQGGNGNGNGNGGHSNNSRGSSGGSLTISPVIDGVTNLSLARRPVGTIWEMGTISEDSMPPVHTAEWSNERFEMNGEGEVRNKQTSERITKDEMRTHGEEVLKGLIEYVHTRMLHEFQFVEQAIPPLEFDRSSVESSFNPNMSMHSSGGGGGMSVRSSSSSICSTADGFRTMVDSDVPRCIFHTSNNFSVAEKLLVFVCSSRGLSCGIWSRSLLLHDGVKVGSMIPYFQAAIKAGYGVLVMNPNMNTQVMIGEDGVPEKLPIHGSSTQEEHCEHVWKKYIFPSAAHKIHFIAYGYGGTLVSNLVEQYKYELKSRLGSVAYIESSHKIDPKWSSGFKRWYSQHSVCWIRSNEPLNTDLIALDRDSTTSYALTANSEDDGASHTMSTSQLMAFGCLCLSAGPCEGPSKSPAFTAKSVLDEVFEFLASPSAYEYQRLAAKSVRLNALKEEEMVQRARQTERVKSSPVARRRTSGAFPLQRQKSRSCPENLDATAPQQPPESVNIEDFQLLRVVGKGAFGKVMLVRRKKNASSPSTVSSYESAISGGKVYAMKVIKKAAVFARNQVEHTKTERRILQGVDHPFMVKLRYAFQNESKLYFVMDYYNGGTLHFHLRRAISFDEDRARFYAAQLVLGISHLHTYNIVYRDLKPENILMDDQGFIAITDFGLSRDNFDSKDGMSTFCGTPEYIAPELIRRIPYGRAVDYWSLGVLIFEMLAGYTPFFNSNRKRNFENILKLPLRLPTEFSDEAKSLLRGLMCKDPSKRLGSGPVGANEIMEHPFFAKTDWEKLYKRDVDVPFRPIVRKDGEVNNVPEFFKRQDAVDSVVAESVPLGKSQVFQDFSYVDPYQL
ncbi:Agc protein kinase [Globisporangium polare]